MGNPTTLAINSNHGWFPSPLRRESPGRRQDWRHERQNFGEAEAILEESAATSLTQYLIDGDFARQRSRQPPRLNHVCIVQHGVDRMLRVLRSEKVRALLPIDKAEPCLRQISALALDQPLVAVRAPADGRHLGPNHYDLPHWGRP